MLSVYFLGPTYYNMKFPTFIIITVGFVQSITQNKHYNVKIDRIDCKPSGPVCNDSICNLTVVSRHEKLLTIGCNFTEPTYLKMEVTYNTKRNGVYRPTVIDKLELDFCAYYDGIRPNAFIQLLSSIKSFRNHTNLITKCPYKGFTGIKEWLLDSSVFPEFIPPGQYRVDSKITHMNGTEIMLAKLYCEVKPKGAFYPM